MSVAGPEGEVHVLVVDDEPHLLRTLTMNLAARGYRVTAARDGVEALRLVGSTDPDLVVLDLGLPDLDGIEVIRRVREDPGGPPILVLSARSTGPEKVAAFEAGATDYVTKPFDISELLARLRAAVRRERMVGPQGLGGPDSLVELGPVTVDFDARLVRRQGTQTPIHLTPTEWRMLETLLRRPGLLTTANELLTAMRGAPEHTARSYLRIYMQQLRRKLEVDASHPRYLLTEPGVGYRYQP